MGQIREHGLWFNLKKANNYAVDKNTTEKSKSKLFMRSPQETASK